MSTSNPGEQVDVSAPALDDRRGTMQRFIVLALDVEHQCIRQHWTEAFCDHAWPFGEIDRRLSGAVVPFCRRLLTVEPHHEHARGMSSTQDAILALARSEALLRPVALESLGLSRVSLSRSVQQGRRERVGRGLYALPDREVCEYLALPNVMRPYLEALA